jgi:putative endonuclease
MPKEEKNYFIYIVSNYKRTTFYTGFTNNLARRIIEHKLGIGSLFSKKYQTKYLMYYEQYGYPDNGINREKEIKKWRREKKLTLIKAINPNFIDLSNQIFKLYDLNQNNVNEIIEELLERNNQ